MSAVEPFDPEPPPGSEQHAWRDMAAEMHRNCEFYQGLVTQIGEMFGVAAHTCDDGSISDSVLALKVPELVAAALQQCREVKP